MSIEEQRVTPKLENPEEVREKLQGWLQQQYPGRAVDITAFDIPENTGMSNMTVLLDVAIKDDAGDMEIVPMVARIQAHGQKLAFPGYDLPMQVAIMEKLATVDGINVPPVVAQETSQDLLGVPFYIMERVNGLIPPDIPPYHIDGWITESTPDERTGLWWSAIDMMARLHKLDTAEEPLASFISGHDFPKGLDEQLAYWENYEQWGLEGEGNKHCSKALKWLRENRPKVENRRFCWGDSRMANVIYTQDKSAVAALLDWEMLCLGDPMQDLAWWVFMDELFSTGLGVPRLEGFPGRQETLDYWCRKTGNPPAHFHYYLVFAGMRISLILARMSLARGNTDMLYESFASHYLDKVLEENPPAGK